MEFVSALTIGLLGSLHCVGMCGPIAMAIPLQANERRQVLIQSLLYQFGRISTYGVLGLIMGILGWGVALAGYQKLFSVVFGIGLIIISIFSISIEQKMMQIKFVQKGLASFKQKMAQMLSITNRSSAFKIGLLNGFLPCGLVYIALAGAVVGGNVLGGAMYMMIFGIGTVPMMMGVMIFGKFSRQRLVGFKKFIPYALILFGAFLIYRGVMLEIPWQLDMWESDNFQIKCH